MRMRYWCYFFNTNERKVMKLIIIMKSKNFFKLEFIIVFDEKRRFLRHYLLVVMIKKGKYGKHLFNKCYIEYIEIVASNQVKKTVVYLD